jgi:hypothetical protein
MDPALKRLALTRDPRRLGAGQHRSVVLDITSRNRLARVLPDGAGAGQLA